MDSNRDPGFRVEAHRAMERRLITMGVLCAEMAGVGICIRSFEIARSRPLELGIDVAVHAFVALQSERASCGCGGSAVPQHRPAGKRLSCCAPSLASETGCAESACGAAPSERSLSPLPASSTFDPFLLSNHPSAFPRNHPSLHTLKRVATQLAQHVQQHARPGLGPPNAAANDRLSPAAATAAAAANAAAG